MSLDTAEFLQTLYHTADSGYVEIRLIGHPTTKLWRRLPLDTINSAKLEALAEHSKTGVTVCYRVGISQAQGSRKQDITHIPALWADVDDGSDIAFVTLTLRMPHVVISSGRGWHGLWLLERPVEVGIDASIDQIERTLAGIAQAVNGDKTKDISRVLRLPGTWNMKYEQPRRCTVYDYYERLPRYDFIELYEEFAVPEIIHHPTRHIPAAAYGQDLPPVSRRYLKEGAGVGSRNATLYAAARGFNDAGYSQGEAESQLMEIAQKTGLKDVEIRRTIASAYRNERAPILPDRYRVRMAAADARLRRGES